MTMHLQTTLIIRDRGAAQAVYGVAGVDLGAQAPDGTGWIFDRGGQILARYRVDPAAEHEGWHTELVLDDCATTHAALLAAGAVEVMPPTTAPGGSVHSAVSRVPGEVLGLHQAAAQ